MTEDFAAYFQARLEEATGGERFPKKTGGESAPRVVRTQLPWREADYIEGEDMPLVTWCVTGGEVGTRGLSSVEARVDCVIWTPGNVVDGSADILRLTNAVLRMARDRGFDGMKLESPVRWTLGEERETEKYPAGCQPHHPYHKSRVYFTFNAPGIPPRCRT